MSARSRTGRCALVAGLAMLFAAPAARAQPTAVTFGGLPTTVGYGLAHPEGVAVDAAGNVYITENSSSFNGLIEVPVGCGGSACQVTLYTSSYPDVTAVAVDKAGNVFVYAQTANLNPGYQVVEIPAGCTKSSCQVVVGGSSNYIFQGYSLAVDAAGDLFIANSGYEAIYKVPVGCIASGTQTCWQEITPMYGIPELIQVVVDAAGDIFFTNNQTDNHYVREVPAGCASVACQVILWSDTSPLTAIGGVGVDAAGNVFFYLAHNSQSGSLLEIPAQEISAGCTSTSSSICITATVLSGLGVPTAGAGNQFAFDALGNILFTDTSNSRVVDLERLASNFGYVNAGSSSTLTLTYNINNTVTLAASPRVVTQGGANLDFMLSSATVPTCTGAQTAPTTCTVTVQFGPIVPGLRQGAVLVYDNSNNLLVTTLIRGIGIGPQLVFPGAQQITLIPAGGASGVATDAAGDVYFSNTASGIVSMIPPGCSTSSCYQSLGGGFSLPLELAVDGAGDLYVPDFGNNQMYLIPPACGSYSCQTKVGNGFGGPAAVALDGAGDIFVAENTNSDVAEVRVVGPQTTVGTLTQPPSGVALNSLGDVFIADQKGGFVEVPSGAQSQFASWLNYFGSSVATDAAGDVYAAQESAVTEVPAGCGSSACDVAVGNGGYQFVSGVALDNTGNVYIADKNAGALYEVQRSQAPTLTFPGTPVNITSSPMTVALQNIGNQPLTFTSLSVGGNANFNVDTGTTTCSTTAALAPGGVCNVGVAFTPSSVGSFTGTLSITDNTLNGSGATQSVPLSGNSPTTPTVTVAAIITTYGSAAALAASATFTGTGGVAPSGTVTFSAPTGTFSAATCTPSGAVLSCASNYTPSSNLAAKTYAGYITTSILAAGSYNAASGTATLTVNRATATVTLGNLTVTYSGSPQSPTVTTVPAGLNTSFSDAPDTPLRCGRRPCPKTGLDWTDAGSYPVTVTVSNSNYAGSASGTFVINPATATVTLGNMTVAYTGSPQSPAVTTVPAGLSTSITGAPDTNAGSYPVTATISNPNYTGSASGTFVINQATATVTLGNMTVAYTGSPQSPTVTTVPAGLITSLTGAPDANAGNYSVTATITSPNYTGSASGTFVINPAAATITLGNMTVTYNGSSQSPTVTTVPAGLNTSLTGAPDTNAGNYPVTATITSPNYTGSASGTFVISQASATVTLSNLTVPYNGSPQSPTVTTVPAGLSTSFTGAPDTNAGSYPVTATISNPNYTGSASGTFVITQATATVTLSNLTAPYNGSPQSPTVTTVPAGLSTSFTGAPDTNAGSYPVTATISNPNYTGSASGTFVITQATATVTLGNMTVAYNGSPQSPTVTTVPAGLSASLTGAPDTNTGSYPVTATVSNPNYTGSASGTFVITQATATVTLGNMAVTYNGSPQSPTVNTVPAGLSTSFSGAPDTNAGAYPVTATVSNPNYTGSASGTFVINPASATVTLGNMTVTYTGSPQSPTVNTVPAGLSTSLTGAPDTNAGSYPLTATITSPNYTGSASGTFVINPTAAIITLSNLSVTYTGSPQSPTVTTVPAGLSTSFTGAPGTNAGSYPVTATISNPNYTGSASGTFVINKGTAMVTLGNLTVPYNGSPQSPTVTTVPTGLSTSFTGAPDTNIGSYAVTATVTNPNYTGSASSTFVINQATATVTLSNLTAPYNGSPQSPTVTTVPAGLTTTLIGAPDTNVGSYPVTATISNPNYNGSASGTFVINKGTATATLGNMTVAYNGSPQSPTVTTAPAGLSSSLTGAPDTNAGSYPVTATISNPNYTGSASGTFVINQATATVTLGNMTVTYNGSPQSPTVTTVPAGLSTSLAGAPDTNAGSYPVTATISNPNYTGSASGTFVINKAAATVTLGNLTVTHNGSPQSPTVTTVPAGLSTSLTGAPDTNAGSYPVTATITDPNYTGSASGTFVIK